MDQHLISTIVSFFKNTLGFNIASFCLAIIGIIISFMLYFRAKRIRLPIYVTKTVNLIKEKIQKISDVEITYKSSRIDNFSVTRIAFWNNGKETINRTDIASGDKVRIVSRGDAKLLDATIIYEKNSINKFNLNTDLIQNNYITIDFDFFDFQEGVIFQVFHTGKTKNDIEILGTIKGAGCVKKNNLRIFSSIKKPFDYFDKFTKKHKKFFASAVLIVTPIMLGLSDFLPKSEPTNFLSKYILLIFITLLYWSLAIIMLRRRVPKGFELFEEEISQD